MPCKCTVDALEQMSWQDQLVRLEPVAQLVQIAFHICQFYHGNMLLALALNPCRWTAAVTVTAYVLVQKLEQIVLLLEPDSHPQRDTSALEQIVYQECSEHVQSASSALGRVLMGPTPSPFWLEQHKLPAALPLWTSAELHKQPNFILSNGRRLTTSCLLV